MSDDYPPGNPTSGPSSPGGSTEKSIRSCYAVVYNLQNRKWVVSGEGGWSEVHLCRDSSDGSHRLLAWTIKSQHVLLNANCTGECIYKEKSKNFHSFVDENGQRFGLGFHKSDSGLKQAEHFLKTVVTVIEESRQKHGEMGEFNLNGDTGRPNPISPKSKVMSPPLSPLQQQQQQQLSDSHSSSTSSKKPPPLPTTNTKTTISITNHNGMSSPISNGINYHSKTNSDHNYMNNTSPILSSSEKSRGGPPPIPNDTRSYSVAKKLPPVPTVASTSGLPSPSFEDDNENEDNNANEDSNKNTKEEEEEKGQMQSPVLAVVNGFDYEAKKKMTMVDLNQPDYHLKSNQVKTAPKGTPLGKLSAAPAKPQKFKKQDDKISDVTSVERKVQVTYDMEAGVFHGVPKEWEELLNKQFGVSPKHIPGIKLPQYSAKIPKVLVVLKEKLVEANGYQQVGIFRLAPDVRDNNAVKSSIDAGRFELSGERADVNVYANLIKVWFRDLPDPLLNCVPPERVEMASKEEDVVKIISGFPEPHKSIFLWLCDMCVECAVYENINKMGPKNLAIVIGPNLFNTTEFENPMKAMTYSAKVVEFFEKAIKWRQSTY